MVDKIWYDWQKKGPKNLYAFEGGSVAPLNNFSLFTQFPNGYVPFLNVSVSSDLGRNCMILIYFVCPLV